MCSIKYIDLSKGWGLGSLYMRRDVETAVAWWYSRADVFLPFEYVERPNYP